MKIANHSKLTLHPLKVRQDKKNFIVEDIRSSEFYEMPAICIDAINMINDGKLLDMIEEVLKSRYPDEAIDMKGFAENLLEYGLVASIDGQIVSHDVNENKSSSGLVWISPSVGRFFFNRYTSILFPCLLIGNLTVFLLKPELFPRYQDVFLFDLMMYNILVFLSLTFLLVIIHEFGHVFAVRAEDLPTKIEIGHRMFFVVLETDMSRVWSLPTEKRYRLYLAGMYFDFIILLAALLTQIIFFHHSLIVGIAKMAVLSTFIRIIYQFCVYMKTDMYYVLENWTGCYNLMENGQNFLRCWLPFIPAEKTSKEFDGEEKLIRPYAVFYLIGVLITIALAIFYNIPLIIHAGILVAPGFTEPMNSVQFWDTTVFYMQFVLILGLLTYSWTEKFRLQK